MEYKHHATTRKPNVDHKTQESRAKIVITLYSYVEDCNQHYL